MLGAFNGGGAQLGHTTDLQNNYEFQNYTSVTARARIPGGSACGCAARPKPTRRPRISAGHSLSAAGLAPELDANNKPVLDASGQPVLVNISFHRELSPDAAVPADGPAGLADPAARRRRLAVQHQCGQPVDLGQPVGRGSLRGRRLERAAEPHLNLGLRYETQTNIHDWRDFAPRIGVAWAPGAAPENPAAEDRDPRRIRHVLRSLQPRQHADRRALQRHRPAAIHRRESGFFPDRSGDLLAAGACSGQTIQEISSTLRAPYIMQSAVGFERQLPLNTTVAITYANSHGLHLLRSEDINAPLPGTYIPGVPGSGVFPLGRPGQVLLMESSGLYNQNQLILNVNSKVNNNISLTGSYMYNHAMSNTDGLGTFPGESVQHGRGVRSSGDRYPSPRSVGRHRSQPSGASASIRC